MATRAEMVKHDYISRDAAIDAVDVGNLHRGIVGALQEIISDIPAADVRPVVYGKWENTGSDVWKCSACNYAIMPWNAGVNFCPNCGADMREVQSNG